MEIIRPGTNFDFIGKKTYALILSCFLILIGAVSLIMHGGPRYGIDFAGGVLVQVKFSQNVSVDEIKEKLNAHMICLTR